MQGVAKNNIELSEMVRRIGLSHSEIAKSLGVPRSSVTLLLNGKYQNKELKAKIEELCNLSVKDFITDAQGRMLAVLEATLDDREFSLIVGPSGIGKTYTINQFIKGKEGVCLYKAQKIASAGEILKQLCVLLGLPYYSNNGAKLQRIKEFAKENVAMFIVDEADLMVEDSEKRFLKKIEIFREISEVTAVALVGLPTLDDAISRCAESYIYSRLGYYARLREPSPEELLRFAHLEGLKNAEKIVGMAIHRGFFRFIKKVARRAKILNNENIAISIMYLGGQK